MTRRLRVPDHTVLVQVLCVREDGAVLLRKIDEGSGSSLAGLWAGLLGEVEDAETLEDAARRLASPLTLPSLQRVAHFQFTEAGDPSSAYEHEMIARSPLGPLPDGCRWVPRVEIEFASMPADDRHWYPRVLDGDLLAGSFHIFLQQTKTNSSRCPYAHSTSSLTMNLTQVTSPSRASCIRTAAAIPWFDIRIDTRTTLCHYAPLPSSNLTTMLKTTPEV